jgi:hypothetical protein
MKANKILIIIALFSNLAIAQTLKTYTGSYQSGQATYQYYENADLERIFNGTFKYQSSRYDFTKVQLDIKGQFKENLKSGQWIGKKSRTFNLNGTSINQIEELIGMYDSGKRVGKWIKRKIEIINGKTGFNEIIAEINFANNNIKDIKSKTKDSYINGKFNNDGNYANNWSIKKDGIEYFVDFKNNIYKKVIIRRESDGNILLSYDVTDILSKRNDDSSLNVSKLIIDGEFYSIREYQPYQQEDDIKTGDVTKGYYSDSDKIKYFQSTTENIIDYTTKFDFISFEIPIGSINSIVTKPQLLVKFSKNQMHEIERAKEDSVIRIYIAEKEKEASKSYNQKKYSEALVLYQI